MLKKIVTAGIGIALFTSPLIVSAQTITLPSLTANPTIEQLQALVVQLTQILQQLIAARAPGTATPSNTNVPRTVQDMKGATDVVSYWYRCALSREGEESGVSGRASRLINNTASIKGMYKEFFMGAEYINRKTDDTQFIKDLYHCVLFRTGEQSGVETRVKQLSTMTREAQLDSLLAGAEFNNSVLPVLTNVIPRSASSLKTPSELVSYWYRCALNREGEASGVSGRVSRLINDAASIEGMYKEFFLATEYANRKTSDEQFVRDLYRCVLFRDGEPSGIVTRVKHLNTMTREGQIDNLLGGAEFKNSVLPVLKKLISSAGTTTATSNEATRYQNMANSLTAMEAALKGMLARLGQ